jgi:siroheme synthase (precorrin-2 oxidase/ferrochelatase)
MAKKLSAMQTYPQVISIVTDYLGPAATRFVDRHIQNHLEKEPAELVPTDLPVLIDWIRISVAFLTEDRKIIDELTRRLSQLSDKAAVR